MELNHLTVDLKRLGKIFAKISFSANLHHQLRISDPQLSFARMVEKKFSF